MYNSLYEKYIRKIQIAWKYQLKKYQLKKLKIPTENTNNYRCFCRLIGIIHTVQMDESLPARTQSSKLFLDVVFFQYSRQCILTATKMSPLTATLKDSIIVSSLSTGASKRGSLIHQNSIYRLKKKIIKISFSSSIFKHRAWHNVQYNF